jgi:hypothetical protein
MKGAQLLELHRTLCSDAATLMESKNHDYTSGSGDPFANFRGSSYLDIHPALGIMLRMQDKMQRVKTFVEKGQLKVKDEGIKDAVIDLINYTVLMYGLITEQKEPATNEAGIPADLAPLFSGASARQWLAEQERSLRRTVPAAGIYAGEYAGGCK